MVAVGIVLRLIYPAEAVKPRASVDKKAQLNRLERRLNTDACDVSALSAIQQEQKFRTLLTVAAAVLSVAAALPSAIRILFLTEYDMEYNARVIESVAWILPATLMVMGICTAFLYLRDASLNRQTDLVKAAIKATAEVGAASPAEKKTKAPEKSNKTVVLGLRIALLAASVILIVAGIFNGGVADVFAKAINICTECIGLG